MSPAQHHSSRFLVAGVDGSESALAAARWAASEALQRKVTLRLVNAANLTGLYSGVVDSTPPADLDETVEREGTEILNAAREAAKQAADVDVETYQDFDSPAVALRNASRSAAALVLGAAGRGNIGTALGSVTMALSSHAECPVVVVRGDGTDDTSSDRPILVGVDGGPLSEPALSHAFQVAARWSCPLTALHVWSDVDTQRTHARNLFNAYPWEQTRSVEERALAERLAGWTQRYPDVKVERVVRRDDPRQALVELSQQARLVVLATRGRGGFAGLLLGSTSLALIQRAACPVMLVGPESATST